MGRIHLGRQDLDELQTRKMKGLKRSRAEQEEGEGVGETHNNDDGDDDDGADDDAEDDDAMSVNSGTGGDESRGESVEDDDDDDKGGVPLNKKAKLN